MNAEAANGPHWFERLQISFIQNIFHLMMSKSNGSGAADYVKTRTPFFFIVLFFMMGHTRREKKNVLWESVYRAEMLL